MKNSIEKALEIAASAHRFQKDKAGKPYIMHPMTLAVNMRSDDEIITALLHDVLEDSEVTEDYLSDYFSDNIIEALQLLTHEKGTDYFEYIHKIRENELAKAVKVQDLIHNSDLSRLHTVTPKDIARCKKYKKALAILLSRENDTKSAV